MFAAHNVGSSRDDINILLLGETGVGKSTFINALVNYLHYNTLDQALQEDLKILIPCSFVLADSTAEEEHHVNIGNIRTSMGRPPHKPVAATFSTLEADESD